MSSPADKTWVRIEHLAWMIAHLAAVRGYCPRGPLRVMYADTYNGESNSRIQPNRGTASVGRKSSICLGKDLLELERLRIIERRDVRVIVVDWDKLHLLAVRARAA